MTCLVFSLLFSAWGFASPHHETAFLGQQHVAVATPDEKFGPNMHFAPISTTMKCVINLTIQYTLVYVALGICRTYCDMTNVRHDDSAVARTLKDASETVFYAPMACLMFVGCRMRVLQLTRGQGNPQDWVQMCMQACTYAILFNTIFVLLVPLVTSNGKKLKTNKTGEIELDENNNPFENDILKLLFTVLRYVAFFALYVGFGGVCVGVFMFEPPAGMWSGPIPPVSPAVACTMTLAIAFFGIFLLMAISRTYSMFIDGNLNTSKFETVMQTAVNCMGMAPMLCVLFLGARMRALQMDPINGNPQRWAQNCFFLCTYALIAQTCVAVFVPLVLGVTVKRKNEKGEDLPEGDLALEVSAEQYMAAKCVTVFRFLIMLSVYGGAVAVVCSVFTIEHPKGAEHTPPLSPTMQCVTNLASQYFFIYLLLWVFYTVKDFFHTTNLDFIKDAVETAKTTVQFAPMICVLFIATRMRALQISNNMGAPQGWAQDGMYLCSWALLVQFLMCLIVPLFTGSKYVTDSMDGSTRATKNVEPKVGEYKIPGGHIVVETIRYLALIALLGGMVTVITSVFLITPETANGRGSMPLVADGTLGFELGPAPGMADVPGAKTGMESVGTTVGSGADVVVSNVPQ